MPLKSLSGAQILGQGGKGLSTAICSTEDSKGGKWPTILEINWQMREHTC